MGKACTLRVCSPGGHVRPSWGIFAKTKEHGNVHMKVDGAADSIMAFSPLYAKSSECLTVSKFVFHRADMFVENEEDQKFLDSINDDLKAQMKSRINPDKWKAITGITIDELFDPNTRKDYTITGPQAVEIGLCDVCKTLTPAIQQEVEALNKKFYQVAATTEQTKTTSKMTLAELKEKHPELFTEVKADVKKEVVASEKDRVAAWMVFYKADPEGVAKGIESGEAISSAKMAELTLKMVSSAHLKNIEGENAGKTETTATDGNETAEQKKARLEVEAFNKELDKHLNLKKA